MKFRIFFFFFFWELLSLFKMNCEQYISVSDPDWIRIRAGQNCPLHSKKALGFSVPSQDVTNQTLNNLVIPGQGEFGLVTSRLGTGKSSTFFSQCINKKKIQKLHV
jgi:hypothetical protein